MKNQPKSRKHMQNHLKTRGWGTKSFQLREKTAAIDRSRGVRFHSAQELCLTPSRRKVLDVWKIWKIRIFRKIRIIFLGKWNFEVGDAPTWWESVCSLFSATCSRATGVFLKIKGENTFAFGRDFNGNCFLFCFFLSKKTFVREINANRNGFYKNEMSGTWWIS